MLMSMLMKISIKIYEIWSLVKSKTLLITIFTILTKGN